jgi:hypothetical protein
MDIFAVIARSKSDQAIHSFCVMDCFAEPVIGRRFAPTRWLAKTNRRPYSITRSFIPASGTKHSSYFPKIRYRFRATIL